MINKSIIDLEQQIIALINDAKMPPAVVSLVLGKILRNVDDLTVETIKKEIRESQNEEDIEIKNENE